MIAYDGYLFFFLLFYYILLYFTSIIRFYFFLHCLLRGNDSLMGLFLFIINCMENFHYLKIYEISPYLFFFVKCHSRPILFFLSAVPN